MKPLSPATPAHLRPRQADFAFDLDGALASMVALRARAPKTASTAETLGVERRGSGVVLNAEGLVATVGYLVIEAENIWLTTQEGRVVEAHALAFDPVSGLGLVQALQPLPAPPVRLGAAMARQPGDRLIVAGAGGRAGAIVAQLVARQEFAGYWEYVIDSAMFTTPSHPHWGGAGVLDEAGRLVGVGSLQIEQDNEKGEKTLLNMIVPIDALTPALADLVKFGRRPGPARPWIGLYALEVGDKLVAAGVADGGPADQAGLEAGDVLLAIDGQRARNLADFWRKLWATGPAGGEATILIERDDRVLETRVRSIDRISLFKAPVLH